MKTRTCIRCKKQKPLQAFDMDGLTDRLSHTCTQCIADGVAKRDWQDTWICDNCGEKPISEFHKTPTGKKRYRKCKKCMRSKLYSQKHVHAKDLVCARCGVVQPVENFIKSKAGVPAGLCHACRERAIK